MPSLALPEVTSEDLAQIVYTSGTTGMPKGARLTHRNVTWVAAACVDALGFQDDDIVYQLSSAVPFLCGKYLLSPNYLYWGNGGHFGTFLYYRCP